MRSRIASAPFTWRQYQDDRLRSRPFDATSSTQHGFHECTTQQRRHQAVKSKVEPACHPPQPAPLRMRIGPLTSSSSTSSGMVSPFCKISHSPDCIRFQASCLTLGIASRQWVKPRVESSELLKARATSEGQKVLGGWRCWRKCVRWSFKMEESGLLLGRLPLWSLWESSGMV